MMSADNDIGLEIAREASAAGLKDFQATLAAFQDRPNPDPAIRPAGGVALPHMGAQPGPRPLPPSAGAPPLPPRPGITAVPPRPGASGNGASGASTAQLQIKADQIALQTMMEARRDFIPNLFKNAKITYKSGKTPADEAKGAVQDFLKRAKSTKEAVEKEREQGRSMMPTGSPERRAASSCAFRIA
jgi:hypothetical protein